MRSSPSCRAYRKPWFGSRSCYCSVSSQDGKSRPGAFAPRTEGRDSFGPLVMYDHQPVFPLHLAPSKLEIHFRNRLVSFPEIPIRALLTCVQRMSDDMSGEPTAPEFTA